MPLDTPALRLVRELADAGQSIGAIGRHLRSLGVTTSNAALRVAVQMVRHGIPVGPELARIPVRQLPSPRQIIGGSGELRARFVYTVRFQFRAMHHDRPEWGYLKIMSDRLLGKDEVVVNAEGLLMRLKGENEEAYGPPDFGFLPGTGVFQEVTVRSGISRNLLR